MSGKDPDVYFCRTCRKWFVWSGRSCLVKHSPGTCCHHYEQQYIDEAPTAQEIEAQIYGRGTEA